jgi:hypothetical protein
VRFKLPVRGVHIGPKCVDGSEYGPDIAAHAHPRGCPPVGWICARTLRDFREHIVHELAHLAADAGHDERWRLTVRRLGGRVPAAYKKRRRS